MSHTKGPWEFKKLAYTKDELYVVMYKTDVYGRRLDNLKGEFKQADAALISTAPELYELLSKINTAFYTRSSKKEWLELMELTKPLLKKARGETK